MRIYEPAAVAHALNRDTEFARNLRKQGLIDGIGQSQGRSNVYTFEEICLLRTGAYVGQFLKSFENGFAFAMERRLLIERAAHDALIDPEDCSNDYILTLTLDDQISTGYSGVTGAPVANITFMPDAQPEIGFLQVNISEIARRVAYSLKAYTRGQRAA